MEVEQQAPPGKCRVIAIDPITQDDCLIGDFDSDEEALEIAYRHNWERHWRDNNIGDMYHVYDSCGRELHHE